MLPFLWLDTGNPKIVAESSQSLVSKTTWNYFSNLKTLGFFKKWDENLHGLSWKPEKNKNFHVVLETRDYEDSATIFGFPVSNHKKT